MTGKLGRAATIATGLASAVVVGTPDSAAGTNFGSGGSNPGPPVNEISLGNNAAHTYSFWDGTNDWRNALNFAAVDGYNPTDINTAQNADDTAADVRVVANGNLNSGLFGWVDCPADGTRSGTDPNEWCINQWLKIDGGTTGGFTPARRKSLMCHEFGHSLGLRHVPDTNFVSCMHPNALGGTVPEAHDVAHLNATY